MNYLPHQQRVVDEKAELDVKRQALDDFLSSPKSELIDPAEKRRMHAQSHIMLDYSEILEDRIAAF